MRNQYPRIIMNYVEDDLARHTYREKRRETKVEREEERETERG